MGIYIQESHVNDNDDAGYLLGDPDEYETYCDTTGELFRAMRREYGRCLSKVYIDAPGGPRAVGWTFQKRRKYEDSPETYLHTVWVVVLERPSETVTRRYYGSV